MATTTRVDGGRDLASEVRAWIARTWDPRMLVRDWWIQLYEAGYAFPTWPVGLGGRGLSAAEARVISHEIGAAHVVGPPNGHLAATLAAPTIFAHGTP